MTSQESQTIYVVGFPKSGNTWLVRLLADCLSAPVLDGTMRNSPEMATDINYELALPENGKIRLAKAHFPVDTFLQEVDNDPKYVVYIVRDFRDVCVSSFFYYKASMGGGEYQISSPHTSTVIDPIAALRRYMGNRKLQEFCRDLSTGGEQVSEHRKNWGAWEDHCEGWTNFLSRDRTDLRSYVIRYEDLLDRPEGCLKRLFVELNINVLVESISVAVQRQSFESLKKKYTQNVSARESRKSRTSQSFFRSGKSGDWRNFMNASTLRIISRNQGRMLQKFGYMDSDCQTR